MPLNPHYLSTACHHTFHDECREVCKFCESPCVCPCHEGQYRMHGIKEGD